MSKIKTAEMLALRDRIERAWRDSPDGWALIETPCTTVDVDAVLRELRAAASCDWVSYSDDDVDHYTDCWYAGGDAAVPDWRLLIRHAA